MMCIVQHLIPLLFRLIRCWFGAIKHFLELLAESAGEASRERDELNLIMIMNYI